MKLTHYFPTFVLLLFVGLRIQAQQETFITDLYSFTNGTDGGRPNDSLNLSGGNLFGTAVTGGTNGRGAVFSVNTDGNGFSALHDFGALGGSNFTNSDGANPYASLILSSNILYGTAAAGGTNGNGTIFSVSTDGTGFCVLYTFSALANNTNNDGAAPYAALVLCSNILYGTTSEGGTNGTGTVFAINTDGSGFTDLYSFSARVGNNYTNDDGAEPYAGLTLSGNTLYGATQVGGTNGAGTVFAINTDGNGFTDLYSFSTRVGSNRTNTDGATPSGGLILSGNTLYGTAQYGGANGSGTVFAISTNGMGFAVLHTFSALGGDKSTMNSDGSNPYGGLVLSGNALFGTATEGGTNGHGTVFTVNTDGMQFSILHSFTGGDGATPEGGLILSGNTLYGTAEEDGAGGFGTVFSLSAPPSIPPLNVGSLGNLVVVFYPVTGTNYMLQTTTNLASGIWVNVTNAVPLVAVGVTNCAPAAFFRLH